LEDRLKVLTQELGEAINESLSESNRVTAAISEIKLMGYDLHMVIEAAIGLKGDETGSQRLTEGGRVGKLKFTLTQEPAQELR
jgi:hypothetical protein